MLQSILSRAALIFISTTLAVLAIGCSKDKQTTATLSNEQPTPIDKSVGIPATETAAQRASSEPELASEPSAIEQSSFEQGLDKAVGAFSISQSAQSTDDWNLVVSQLQDAIALMKKVPVNSPYFRGAQTKITEYQRQMKYAQQKATPPIKQSRSAQTERIVVVVPEASVTPITLPLPASFTEKLPLPLPTSSPAPLTKQEVFAVPIKRRMGGTPIIEVTFNGNQKFEMIVDTGASGTVITEQMASTLSVVPVGKAKANTASSKAVEFPVGYVDSIEVGGVMVNQIAVAIAGSELETGLLGHDFFGNYDLTIKRDVVEFRPQSQLQINSVETELTAPTSPNDSVEFP